jgi:hypothetical protein
MNDMIEKNVTQSDNIIQFAVKTCIVAIVISACTIFVADWVIGSLQDAVREMRIGGRQFWSKIENELHQAAAASSDLPPEKKQRLLNDVRIIVARWRPFVDAVRTEMEKPVNAPNN